jgi:Flp pilus assembly protein TadG
MTPRRRWRHAPGFTSDVAGATAVEFAFVAPVLLLFLFGIFQGGLMLWTQSGLQHAAEQAARCASINSTLCGTHAQVQAFASSQSLGRGIPATAFTKSVAACGVKVHGAYAAEFLIWPVSLSATSYYPV